MTNVFPLIGDVKFDYIKLTYTIADLTKVEYFQGGAGGTIVTTLDLTYLAGILQTVTKT